VISAGLQKAVDSLEIQDVYVRDLLANCAGEFDPKYDDDVIQLDVQWMHLVRKSTVVEFDGEDPLLRVFIRLGVRWVDSTDEDNEQDNGKDDELLVRASIEAEFIAEYRVTAELERACIEEFCLKNASYHIWPYWRELLSNQCSRMHLPRLILPAVQLADNRHQSAEALESAEEIIEDQ